MHENLIVLPHWYATGFAAFAVLCLAVVTTALRSRQKGNFVRVVAVLGGVAGVAASLSFAYHVALGHPLRFIVSPKTQ